MPIAAAAAILVVLVAIVGIAVVSSGGSSDDRSDTTITTPDDDAAPDADSNESYDEQGTTYDDEYDETTTTRATTTSETTTTPATRSATLFSGDAKVRSAPNLYASDVTRITGHENDPIDVIGEPTADGWYHVDYQGWDGYLFGAFVIPPAPGWCVGTSVGPTPYVTDATGGEITDEKSGNKVLMSATAPTNGRWPVVLPGGARGFVSDYDIELRSCG
ncbi:MAG: SH3 domain-containing protein [Acidimicrobiales bacterium]|nr:SH3 domain-containing protein [Acidimicrobiales bacterium]